MTDEASAVRSLLLLLDADVLYPIRICDFILTAASRDMLQRPIVSDTILDEASRNIRAVLKGLGRFLRDSNGRRPQ